MKITQWTRRITEFCFKSDSISKKRQSRNKSRCFKNFTPFLGGFALGLVYYHYILKKIAFPANVGFYLALCISLFLAFGNVVCMQLKCISLLTLLMYCGKPGRGVLKVLVLTYVVAGPITNMSLNAKEIVRVYACSTYLSQNLSGAKYAVLGAPFRSAIFSLTPEISQMKDTIRSIHDVIHPILIEIEDRIEYNVTSLNESPKQLLNQNRFLKCRCGLIRRIRRTNPLSMKLITTFSKSIIHVFAIFMCNVAGTRQFLAFVTDKSPNGTFGNVDAISACLVSIVVSTATYIFRARSRLEDQVLYGKRYYEKLEMRCEKLMEREVAYCANVFSSTYEQCIHEISPVSSWVLCRPMKLSHICNMEEFMGGLNICDNTNQSNPGLGEGYIALKNAQQVLTSNRDVFIQYRIKSIHQLFNVQDAKETGDRVMHAFEEKYIIVNMVTTAVNVCVAVLFLRIFTAAVAYHDQYLTDIEYDNVYVTGRFKKIDRKRKKRNQLTILPLKKMERSRYVDVHSLRYLTERDNLVTHILKVLLEVVTATTFVMLDRLFYEALDVVRQHAETELPKEGSRDLEIEVEGSGLLANMVRTVLGGLNVDTFTKQNVSNHLCLPHPQLIPTSFYLKIYGGYLWILLLLYIDPYTVRLRRLVCGYFYPCREKQRILHLYNDILKKRMKMQKTLRRKAIQAVRAHYLSGENMLSLRMKFPRLLEWLRVFPAARMTCLICGETEPREHIQKNNIEDGAWHSCAMAKCPFIYCFECWQEVGARCLACDPSLDELSDVESLSEDDLRY